MPTCEQHADQWYAITIRGATRAPRATTYRSISTGPRAHNCQHARRHKQHDNATRALRVPHESRFASSRVQHSSPESTLNICQSSSHLIYYIRQPLARDAKNEHS